MITAHARRLRALLPGALLAALIFFPALARAQTVPESPLYLRDHLDELLAIKRRAIWQEARAEMTEGRGAERGSRGRRGGHRHAAPRAAGEKMRPAVIDEDAAAGRLPSRAAMPDHAGSTFFGPGPANVLVNNRAGDAANAAQSEEDVAMLGLNGIAAWNDGQGFINGAGSQGLGVTTDGGQTWTTIPVVHPGGVPPQFWFSDPAVALNAKTGEFYFAAITLPGVGMDGVGVARGHFSGGSLVWDGATSVRAGLNSQIFFDKEWIAADSASGNVYLSYTVFGAAADTIVFQRSTDGGSTFNDPVTVNTSGFGNVQGSRPAVGPLGQVYVAWQEAGPTNDFMDVRVSLDHGASFGAQVQAVSEWSNGFSGAPGFNRPFGITFPSIAVDRSPGPHRGRVFLSWNEGLDITGDPLGGSPKGEVETNNFFIRATPFTAGRTLIGNLARLDFDYWSFPATQGTTYIFYTSAVAAGLNYTMRVFCADTLTRLAFTGDPDSTQGSGQPSLIEWTAPTTDTYYLRMAQSAGIGSYTIVTGTHTPVGTERARDHRDVFASWSDDGASWATPVRMNDDSPWFDNWFPEVAVSTEGYVYSMWYDWRDALTTCGGSSNIGVSRSTDGGASWAANTKITTATTAWTTTPSNIVPNQGDYLGMYGGGSVVYTWADGRLGNPDVFSGNLARDGVGATLACPPDSVWPAGTTHNVVASVGHENTVWDDSYTLALTSGRAWPGFPASQSIVAPSASTTPWSFAVTVPDSAALGTDHLCFQLTQPNGVVAATCCFTLTIASPLAVGPGGVADLALSGAWPNPASQRLGVAFTLPSAASATLELLDVAGRRVVRREVGGMGPGAHVLDLSNAAAELHSGVYTIRLTQAGRTRTGKVTIVR